MESESNNDIFKMDVCSFRVPVNITEKDGEKIASFKEVEMKDLCIKIVTHDTTDRESAIKLGQEVASQNQRALKIAERVSKDLDMVIRKVLCIHGKIKINNNK